jgi:hypothetical protein
LDSTLSNLGHRSSESDDRAESDAQVVVRSLIEIDLVAGLQAESYWTQGGFYAGTGVQRGVQVRRTEIQDRAHDVDVGEQAGAEAEINESGFHRGERVKMAFAPDQRGAKESVSDADGSALNSGYIASDDVAVRFIEVESVVVGEFAFKHDILMNAETDSRTHTKVVGAGLRDVERIQKNPHLDSLLSEREAGQQE